MASDPAVPYRHAGLIVGSVATENGRVGEVDRAGARGMAADARGRPDLAELEDANELSDRLLSARSRLDAAHRRAVLVRCSRTRSASTISTAVRADRRRHPWTRRAPVAKRLFDQTALSFAIVGDTADVNRPAPLNRPIIDEYGLAFGRRWNCCTPRGKDRAQTAYQGESRCG